MNTQLIQTATQNVSKFVTKNSPTILTSLAVAGLVSTTVMGVRATPKALMLLEAERAHRRRMFENEQSSGRPSNYILESVSNLDAVKLTWKCYIPSFVMASVTIACIISANSVNLRRNAALAGAYSLAESTLKEYKAKVVETIGENKEKKVREDIAKDVIAKNPVKDGEVIITGKGDMLCYEVLSGRYFKNDIENLRQIANKLARDMLNDNFISVNDVYYELGLSNTKLGDELGWQNYDGEGLFAFEFSSQLSENGEPCLVVDYFTTPSTQYMDFH